MRLIALAGLCLLTSACHSSAASNFMTEMNKSRADDQREIAARQAEADKEVRKYAAQRFQQLIDDSVYVQDKRTGLCFNIMNNDYRGYSHTAVPCGPVLEILNK